MKIFKARNFDLHQGWVWLKDDSISFRSIVKIYNPSTRKSIYCEALQLDRNYLDSYKKSTGREIVEPYDSLVISAWYRYKLGGLNAQENYSLTIIECNSLWSKFMACLDHPQAIVRVSSWLGLIGVVLGSIGLFLGLKDLIKC